MQSIITFFVTECFWAGVFPLGDQRRAGEKRFALTCKFRTCKFTTRARHEFAGPDGCEVLGSSVHFACYDILVLFLKVNLFEEQDKATTHGINGTRVAAGRVPRRLERRRASSSTSSHQLQLVVADRYSPPCTRTWRPSSPRRSSTRYSGRRRDYCSSRGRRTAA